MFVFSKGQPKSWNPIKDREKWNLALKGSKYKTSFIQNDGSRVFKENRQRATLFKKKLYMEYPKWSGFEDWGHPAVFPEQLANDHIISWSNEGDIVFDPFMGSGTTGKKWLF